MTDIPADLMKMARDVYSLSNAVSRFSNIDNGALIIARALADLRKSERERFLMLISETRTEAENFRNGLLMSQNESWSAQGAISACNDLERAALQLAKGEANG